MKALGIEVVTDDSMLPNMVKFINKDGSEQVVDISNNEAKLVIEETEEQSK